MRVNTDFTDETSDVMYNKGAKTWACDASSKGYEHHWHQRF